MKQKSTLDTEVPRLLRIEIDGAGRLLRTPFIIAAEVMADRIERDQSVEHSAAIALAQTATAQQRPDLYAQHSRLANAWAAGPDSQHWLTLPAYEQASLSAALAAQQQQRRQNAIVDEFNSLPPSNQLAFMREIDRILARDFGGDRNHYADAFNVAAARYPDLAAAYQRSAKA